MTHQNFDVFVVPHVGVSLACCTTWTPRLGVLFSVRWVVGNISVMCLRDEIGISTGTDGPRCSRSSCSCACRGPILAGFWIRDVCAAISCLSCGRCMLVSSFAFTDVSSVHLLWFAPASVSPSVHAPCPLPWSEHHPGAVDRSNWVISDPKLRDLNINIGIGYPF